MDSYVKVGTIHVAEQLFTFIENDVLPKTDIDSHSFWQGLQTLLEELTPENERLLKKREEIQQKLNDWNMRHKSSGHTDDYVQFLKEIRYLEGEIGNFKIGTENLDDELTKQAGPQLVVPANNARYVINAANSRWGSLYDALYGTDVIDETEGAQIKTDKYNPMRGEKVVQYAKKCLDEFIPLKKGSHLDAVHFIVSNQQLLVERSGGELTELQIPGQFIGYCGTEKSPTSILLKHNGLHIDIQIDREHPIGKADSAGVKDVVIESALSTIIDFEDSVTAVDAEDKVDVYRNWLGLMKGTLSVQFKKGNQTVDRSLNENREYTTATGERLILSGRSLLLVRNVGHLMKTDLILNDSGEEMPEGIIDTVVTSLIAKHDLLSNGRFKNSQTGSVYIVKPKMHGSEEVAFANTLFERVEQLLGLAKHTLKIGVMDEERRTSLNLKQCIFKVKDRIFFINTGFLDRTGDEIHSSFYAGPMVRKSDMKSSTWLNAYEKSNVQTGLASKLNEQGQIGKGMWPMPNEMKAMMDQKIGHLIAGGNTAWVPSPTAATLHALHYHQVIVDAVQESIRKNQTDYLQELLHVPVEIDPSWSREEVQQELETNAQSILGYVVRWVEHGIGCSKVPNLDGIGLMEDRATLRISSQHISNWLYHQICSEEQVIDTMKKMARVVDEQNAHDPYYVPMSNRFEESVAFQAALELVLDGKEQPNGYTEPILHRRRREYKSLFKKEGQQEPSRTM